MARKNFAEYKLAITTGDFKFDWAMENMNAHVMKGVAAGTFYMFIILYTNIWLNNIFDAIKFWSVNLYLVVITHIMMKPVHYINNVTQNFLVLIKGVFRQQM